MAALRAGSVVLVLLGLVACGGRPGGGPNDVPDDGGAGADAAAKDAAHSDAPASTDGGDPCACPTDVVYRPTLQYGECVPPLQLGCAATACTPGVTDCGQGYSCDEWGAAACCYCQAAVPACILTGPAQGPLPEYLKLASTYGPAQQQQIITIQGFPFYVGALYYLVRFGDSSAWYQLGGTTCSFDVSVPPHAAGMESVWVSQYGGDDPWVLAGFFTFSAGDYPTCVQPGYPCAASNMECCQTSDVPMACTAGRCRRQ
jgi:hypothetical protein